MYNRELDNFGPWQDLYPLFSPSDRQRISNFFDHIRNRSAKYPFVARNIVNPLVKNFEKEGLQRCKRYRVNLQEDKLTFHVADNKSWSFSRLKSKVNKASSALSSIKEPASEVVLIELVAISDLNKNAQIVCADFAYENLSFLATIFIAVQGTLLISQLAG